MFVLVSGIVVLLPTTVGEETRVHPGSGHFTGGVSLRAYTVAVNPGVASVILSWRAAVPGLALT